MPFPFTTTLLILALTPIGQFGATYPIVEKDVSVEMEERMNKIDVDALRTDMQQKFRNFTPSDWRSLPPAPKNTSYTVDMTYTLQEDIPLADKKGKITGILYPKGFTFNPLEYTLVDPIPLVVFNADSQVETEWVKHWYKDKNVILVATQGNLHKASEQIGNQVYYLKEIMAQRLNITNTVSVVSRSGTKMKVDVYAIEAEARAKANAKEASK